MPQMPPSDRGPAPQKQWQQNYDAARKEHRDFYNARQWRKISSSIRARDPLCMMCSNAPSVLADHIIPRLQRPDLAYDPQNLQGLCTACHNLKTANEKKSGR